jgi:hypothetical protein
VLTTIPVNAPFTRSSLLLGQQTRESCWPVAAPRIMLQSESRSSATLPVASGNQEGSSTERRLAKPIDITAATNISNGAKRYWINHLCKYRNSENMAWPKISTAMADLVVSERSVQNYRAELIATGWICLPEGDAGGRPSEGGKAGLVIHLHPTGCACSLPRVKLKQRSAQGSGARVAPNVQKGAGHAFGQPTQVRKGEESAPLRTSGFDQKGAEVSLSRVQITMDKGADNDDAIRKELLIEPFTRELSTAAMPHLQSEEASDGLTNGVGGDSVSNATAQGLRSRIFGELEQMCNPPLAINSVGRMRILKAAQEQNFSLQQLCYAWRHDARSQTGGLIRLAEHWLEETAHLSWPQCLDCEDTGTAVPKFKVVSNPGRNDSGRYGANRRAMSYRALDRRGQGFEFCNCPMGMEAHDATRRAQDSLLAEQLQRERENERRTAAAKAAQDLIVAAAEASRQKSNAEAESIKMLQADHICPKCEGSCGRQQYGSWHLCVGCLGTGQYFTGEEFQERGTCARCHGTGSTHDSRQAYTRASKKCPWMIGCPACHGSGKAQVRKASAGASE